MEKLRQLLYQLDTNSSVSSIESTFSKIAEILLLHSKISIGDKIYTIEEIEFYYFKNGCLNGPIYNCTYPRDCRACDFFFHYSGVDICFESTEDSFGGVLIRSLKKKEDKNYVLIGGPLRCANELANTSIQEGKKIELIVDNHYKKDSIIERTIRQGIKADYETKDKKVFPKVRFCYYIKQKNKDWSRTREGVYKPINGTDTKEFNPTQEVTDRYKDNPEDRINNIESGLNKS